MELPNCASHVEKMMRSPAGVHEAIAELGEIGEQKELPSLWEWQWWWMVCMQLDSHSHRDNTAAVAGKSSAYNHGD